MAVAGVVDVEVEGIDSFPFHRLQLAVIVMRRYNITMWVTLTIIPNLIRIVNVVIRIVAFTDDVYTL